MARIVDFPDGFTSNSEPSVEAIDLTADVTGILPIGNGGTGSATRNFVDLTSTETIGGDKTFSGDVIVEGTVTANGLTTIINSQTLEVADKNITINDGGNDASSEGAGITVERTGTDGSIVYENALDNKFKVGEVGSEVEIVGTVKDTKANLDALGSYSTSNLYYATDENLLYRYGGTSLVEVGAGGGAGDSDTLHLINVDDISLSDIDLTGNNADFDGGGTITASSLSLSTTAADLLTGEQVIKYSPASNGQNDYFGFTKTIVPAARGRNVGFVFNFKNDSTVVNNDFRFCVKQKDGAQAGDIEYFDMESFNTTNNSGTRFSVGSFVAENCTEIEYGWQNTSTTTTVELFISNIKVSQNPFIYKNLNETIKVLAEGCTGQSITANTEDIQWTEVADDSGIFDGRIFTSPFTGKMTIHGSTQTGSASYNLKLYKDGVVFKNLEHSDSIDGDRVFSYVGDVTEGEAYSIRFSATETIVNNADRHYLNVYFERDNENIITPVRDNVVSVRAEGNAGESITANVTDIPFTEVQDTASAFDGSVYTVQDGDSILIMSLGLDFTSVSTRTIELYKNGTKYKHLETGSYSAGERNANYTSTRGEFAKDDELTIRVATGGTLANDTVKHYLNILEYRNAKLLSAIPRDRDQFLEYQAALNTFQDLSGELRFPSGLTSSQFDISTPLTIVDDSGNTRTKFQALYDCKVSVSFSAAISSGVMQIFKEGSAIMDGEEKGVNEETQIHASSFKLAAGEFFSIGSSGSLPSNTVVSKLLVSAKVL